MKARFFRAYIFHILIGVVLLITIFKLVGRRPLQSGSEFDARVARPAFTTNHPRLLFDEAHRNFHTTTARYRPFAELIRHDGVEVTINHEPLTRSSLKDFQILAIANARGAGEQGTDSAFTDDECNAIRDWVKDGGALLLITDLEPFGSAAEKLAASFGVGMGKAFVFDPKSTISSATTETSIFFDRRRGTLAEHPIANGRDADENVTRVAAFAGQSLKGPEGSMTILKLADSAYERRSQMIDSRHIDGIPGAVPEFSEPVSAAGRALVVAFEFGRGRVVVSGEAAMFTSQIFAGFDRPAGLTSSGFQNRQFTLNTVRWLARAI